MYCISASGGASPVRRLLLDGGHTRQARDGRELLVLEPAGDDAEHAQHLLHLHSGLRQAPA